MGRAPIPPRGRQPRASKADKARAKLQREMRQNMLAAMGPFRLARPPRTAAEEQKVYQAALQKARMEGKTGQARRERAQDIMQEAIAEAKQSVRLVLPGQGVIQKPPEGDGLKRTDSGLLILPEGVGLVGPPQ